MHASSKRRAVTCIPVWEDAWCILVEEEWDQGPKEGTDGIRDSMAKEEEKRIYIHSSGY